jgi:hypothetical protein
MMTCEEVIEQCGAGASNVQVTCGAGSETGANLRHIVYANREQK